MCQTQNTKTDKINVYYYLLLVTKSFMNMVFENDKVKYKRSDRKPLTIPLN